MARFRLMERDAMGNKVGPHSVGPVVNGRFAKTYKAGDVIESDRPLDQVFRGKFERLDGPSPEPEAESKPQKAKGRSRK